MWPISRQATFTAMATRWRARWSTSAAFRTLLALPLRIDERFLGLFGIYRQDVLPFTEKQITLVEGFAAQAVIAMENARLITETREALEQQNRDRRGAAGHQRVARRSCAGVRRDLDKGDAAVRSGFRGVADI